MIGVDNLSDTTIQLLSLFPQALQAAFCHFPFPFRHVCRSLNLVYKIPCLDCKALGKRAIYIGESHRSFWDRTQEHLADIRSKNTKNSLVKHWEEVHGDQDSPPRYSFQVKRNCKSAKERQIWEALYIEVENSQGDYQINSKSEFGINLMPKLKPILQEDEAGAQNHRKRSNQQVQQPQIGHPNADRNGFETQYSQRVKRRKLNTFHIPVVGISMLIYCHKSPLDF